MGVILDIEWIQRGKKSVCLTQLSALRVGSDWSLTDRLDMVICPPQGIEAEWGTMPFHGHISAEYQSGETEKNAILRFVNWIKPQEDIYVWDDNSLKFIADKYKKYFSAPCPLHFLTLRKCVMGAIKKDGFGSMTIYGIADAYQFNTPKIDHCSQIDVDILRAIVRLLGIGQNELPGYQESQEKKKPSPAKTKAPKKQAPQKAKLYNDMVIGAKNSRSKIVHMPHCRYVKQISSNNRIVFPTLRAARESGYRLCNCCPNIARKFHAEKDAVSSFAETHHLDIRLYDGFLEISSRFDKWRITTAQTRRARLVMFHKNKREKLSEDTESTEVTGYHEQAFKSSTIIGYLKNIAQHDEYREKTPYRPRPTVHHKKQKWVGIDSFEPYVEKIRNPRGKKHKRKRGHISKRQRMIMNGGKLHSLQALMDEETAV